MKHHSPNFLRNYEEAEKAEYSYLKSGLTILGLLLIAAFALTSCTKEVNNPLTAPQNRPVPVTIHARIFELNNVWVVDLNVDKPVKTPTRIALSWYDDLNYFIIQLTIQSGYNQVTGTHVGNVVTAKGEAKNVKLLGVEGGEKNTFYTINITP